MSDREPQNHLDEPLVDLLVKQVTEGLSAADERSLAPLDNAEARATLRDLEHAAAAIALSGIGAAGPLPPLLRARIERQAEQHYTVDSVSGAAAAGGRRAPALPGRTAAPRRGWGPTSGGWWAAAACLLLALFGWLRTPPRPALTALPSLTERRAALLAQAHSLKIDLGATQDPGAAGVRGDVVWDPVTQRGYMHFVGLAPNDPQIRQYQLWIFDAARDQRYPVDGGVFDIPANSADVIVPIHAALPVVMAKAFAVTVEKPGGAVVSGREHVVVLGQVG